MHCRSLQAAVKIENSVLIVNLFVLPMDFCNPSFAETTIP